MRWFAVRATFAAILVGAYLLIELAAKFYVADGLGIHTSNYESFYLNDPDYKLMMWNESYKPHPYIGYVRPVSVSSSRDFAKSASRTST